VTDGKRPVTLGKDPTGEWEMWPCRRGSCKMQLEETCTATTTARQRLVRAQALEMMEVKTLFSNKMRKPRLAIPHPVTTYSSHNDDTRPVRVYKFCLAEKSDLKAVQHARSTGTNAPLDSTRAAAIKT